MNRRDWTCLVLAVFVGGFAWFVDVNSTEVQATVLTLLITGVLLGFAQPRRWWLWGVAAGATIPLAYGSAAALGLPLREWPQPNTLASALAIAPALAATALGAFLARGTVEGRP